MRQSLHIVCDIIPCIYFSLCATEMCDWDDEETHAPLVQMATCNPCAFYRLSVVFLTCSQGRFLGQHLGHVRKNSYK